MISSVKEFPLCQAFGARGGVRWCKVEGTSRNFLPDLATRLCITRQVQLASGLWHFNNHLASSWQVHRSSLVGLRHRPGNNLAGIFIKDTFGHARTLRAYCEELLHDLPRLWALVRREVMHRELALQLQNSQQKERTAVKNHKHKHKPTSTSTSTINQSGYSTMQVLPPPTTRDVLAGRVQVWISIPLNLSRVAVPGPTAEES